MGDVCDDTFWEDTTVNHADHTRLDVSELTDAVLTGATVYGPGDETIGTISHVHGMGEGAHVIIDVGGFLGIGAKPVSVPASKLDLMRDGNGEVHAVTTWTKEDLKAMPEHHH
ncbi:PRC-barrel domain containing protein [Paracoccus sp. ME4]|uniref:PRC-barrel domain containing protein n=1 Tax=Paracoccus sp. ME4 TaxID=3138066 RepID=UPI00398AF678